MSADYFDAGHLIGHVKDAEYFEVPRMLSEAAGSSVPGKLFVPQIRESTESLVPLPNLGPLSDLLEPLDLHITKFMVLELFGALVLILFFVGLALHVKRRDVNAPRGVLWNMLESMLLFIRDDIARPAIGHDGDKFLPFLWTMFFFVLMCNLLGMIPWLGSPTGALATTGALALITFLTVVLAGSKEMGIFGFWKNQVPHMDLPVYMLPLKIGIFFIEVLGLLIKHFVLAIRLLANMMAGHLVLAVIVAFIAAGWNLPTALSGTVTVASVLGGTALSMLELFVAFLQAYIFTFLSALFIGMAVHPH
jgi:F-type H+-transporting ATPase subunit a